MTPDDYRVRWKQYSEPAIDLPDGLGSWWVFFLGIQTHVVIWKSTVLLWQANITNTTATHLLDPINPITNITAKSFDELVRQIINYIKEDIANREKSRD